MAAARTAALNPAPARRVERAWDWPHSSVKQAPHPVATTGSFSVQPLIDRTPRFADLLDMVLNSTIPR